MSGASAVAAPRSSVVTRLAETQPDGSVRCAVCAHRCLVRPGRRGICAVRENVAGRLISHAYGGVAAVGVDPIEKKPLFHVAPGATAYSIATPGCPFHCTFCQNWEISQGPRLGIDVPTRPMSPDDVVAAAVGVHADAIAYTYVEPTVFLEYALDTARAARTAGLLNLFVTDGYATPEAIAMLGEVIDAANVDLKAFDDAFYRRLCGARLAHVLDGIVAMRDAGIWVEVTTLVIPGRNDTDEELRALARWIAGTLGPTTPWHISRFHPAYRMGDAPRTPIATLLRAFEIGREAGLRHVYVGNAPDLGLEDTRCAGCDRLLVARAGYAVRTDLTPDGRCPGCDRPLEGRAFDRRAPAPSTRGW